MININIFIYFIYLLHFIYTEKLSSLPDHAHHNHSDHGDHDHGDHDHGDHDHVAIAWVGGFVSITVISLMSLVGVVLIPLMNKVFFKFLLSFLVALAVGTLSGDAFLHLLPHSLGGQHHHHHHHPPGAGAPPLHEEEDLDGVWKGLAALSGVYVMFLIEHFLTLGKMYKDKKQKVRGHGEDTERSHGGHRSRGGQRSQGGQRSRGGQRTLG
ncbi:Zinc transporter ZIP6 [Liparis tanakae]|uniref:Zinc transporter ZIP6 n=1 Tax=Liparis tanakae TaxID=230148 RepID=A0A4Z2F6A0_9TELE|nr:Zinc transporter ZIP6 [Liparis tanakae]